MVRVPRGIRVPFSLLWTAPLIARKIPYAVILGNHDSESGPLTRDEQMQIISNMPYSYSMNGPALITGSGNYYLKLESGREEDRAHVATLWFMDTGARAEKDKWKPWSKPGYGYVHKDQIEWFRAKYIAIKETLLPYKPDGAKDLAQQQWRARRRSKTNPQKRDQVWDAGSPDQTAQTLGRPPSIVFMHIPVPESMNPPDKRPLPKIVNPTRPSRQEIKI